jgi:60 kDa SS-A/Ro ribonucleoprotein
MTNYLKNAIAERLVTPQSQPIPGREPEMVQNSAGGFTFQIDDFGRLERFLILGSEGGTYYANERDLTKQNVKAVERAIAEDGPRVVQMVVDISHSGRAPKNDPALLVLAMCAGSKDLETRRAALAILPKVARIGTHLFHFVDYAQVYRGWGRALRRAIGNWYAERSVEDLVNQVIKYRQRDGWSHRDLLRLSHPKVTDDQRRAILQWVTHPDQVEIVPDALAGAIQVMETTSANEAVPLIRAHRLPREVVPTDLLNEPLVWEALLENMPMTAMIRNLGKMSQIGLLTPLSAAATHVCEKLSNAEAIQRARVHPIAILLALKTYAQGHGERGKLSWTPVGNVVDALNDAFYKAFKNVQASGKRQLLAVDVSGSMGMGGIAGTSLTPREGAAAMALILASVEKNSHIVGFHSSSGRGYGIGRSQDLSGISPLEISPRMRLDTVVKYMSGLPFGGTDCALPMLYASAKNLDVDAFTVITDNETWAGSIQPVQALNRYRADRRIPARSVVVGMTASSFTIADPNDPGMMDVVGFDAAAPQLISDFIRG